VLGDGVAPGVLAPGAEVHPARVMQATAAARKKRFTAGVSVPAGLLPGIAVGLAALLALG
jgi:hypothetical protein